jgi:uncharacterized delta-60 repeat protein
MVFALGLALVWPASSGAASGPRPEARLDPSFGGQGLVRLLSEPSFTAFGTTGPEDDLLVSGGTKVQVLNGRGGVGRAFGGAGSVVPAAAPENRFGLGGFTTDGQGRLLVVGASLLPEAENPSPTAGNLAPAFSPAAIRILRFLPDGRLDPSFGQDGVVETDLGLPAPSGEDGEALGTHPAPRPEGIVVDPQGRIVVTGGAVTRLVGSCGRGSGPVPVSAGFVARFDETGAIDPSFGDAGLFGGYDGEVLGAIGDPTVSRTGAITFLSGRTSACEEGRPQTGLRRLTPDGRIDPAFGTEGAVLGTYRALAEAPDGSSVALEQVPRHGRKARVKARLVEIAADGTLDRAFGKGGRTAVSLGAAYATSLESLAVDRRGRVLVGGTLQAGKGRSILLLRVTPGGRLEKNFGPHGRVATSVPGLEPFGASEMFFDRRGRLVTVHQYQHKEGGRAGLVLARYLLTS